MPTEEILRSALWNSPTVISSSAATSASFGVRRSVASRCVTACSTARALVRTDRGTQSIERSSSMMAPLMRGMAYVSKRRLRSGSKRSMASISPMMP